MGKLIYQTKGKAKEYSPWACNLYNGCSNSCVYCYNRKGVACKLLGKDEVTVKSNLNRAQVRAQFIKELQMYKEKINADGKGLFFNFVSDPFLPETWELNTMCAIISVNMGVPVVFLSKKVPNNISIEKFLSHKDMVKIGFTLTGHDHMEPGADTNEKRIDAIYRLSTKGINVWASIEPVIDIPVSQNMIEQAYNAGCREFKIGLLSGKKEYSPIEVLNFMGYINFKYHDCNIYWKDSVTQYIECLR